MSERFEVDAPGGLFEFLTSRLPDWNRNTLRQRLRAGCVRVNDDAVLQARHPLIAGDRVEVVALEEGRPVAVALPGVEVLYEDELLIAIDKPAGLLSVSTERQGERERTALALVRDALSRPGHPARLWPVHRLDRETSGVLLFARSREACEEVRAEWSEVHKTYLAIVEGEPRPPAGVIEQPLWEDRGLNVRVGAHTGAKQARTHYATLASSRGRALLEVRLDTGRRHQIRAHLAWLGHPIVGDRRYGTPGPSLGLHALRLELLHPRHRRPLSFTAAPPHAFSGFDTALPSAGAGELGVPGGPEGREAP